MAKENDRTITSEEYVGSVVYDADGNEILRQGVRTTEYEADDGHDGSERISQNLVLEDGRIWNISQMARPGQHAVFVSQCPVCLRGRRSIFRRRGRNSLGLSPTSSMRRCFSCGTYICSKHYVLSADNHIRCRRCNGRYFWVHRVLKPIFFEEVKP